MKNVILVLVLLVSVTTFGDLVERDENPKTPQGYFYVGCRPSPSECRYSCGNGNYIALIDQTLCDGTYNPYERMACYCSIESAE